MKALKIAGFCAAFALIVASYFNYATAGVPLPLPGTSGPSLGDTTTNLYTLMQAMQNNRTAQFTSYTTQTGGNPGSGQNQCQQLTYGFSFLTYTLGGTGSVCLPPAIAGSEMDISNNTSQTVNIFTVTPTTLSLGAGAPNDYINGSIGTSAYTGLTNGKTSQCIAMQAGNWWCTSGN